ncbi:MAG: DUF4340 domain-containing protein [Bacteroidales bacterium]|jgi:hypothetical protein|nr:DUF4340 domain-containing protein [Bacteroidales bacterium]
MSSKKSKRLILSICIFVILAVIVILQFTVFNKRGERNFKEILNPVDYNTIDRIEYIMPSNNIPAILTKEGNIWKITRNDTTYTADYLLVENVLRETTKVKPARIVAVSKDKLEEYDFKDDKTIPVKYFSNGKVVAEYHIGGYEFLSLPSTDPNGRPRDGMFTFIKEPKSDIIYSIWGFLRTFFNSDINLLRNKIIYNINNNDDILEVVGLFNDESNNFLLVKNADNLWVYNGNIVDDENINKINTYLQKVKSQTGIVFYQDEYSKDNVETITIKGNNFSPIVLNFYPIENTKDYVYESNTYNEGVFYDKNGSQRGRLILEF